MLKNWQGLKKVLLGRPGQLNFPAREKKKLFNHTYPMGKDLEELSAS